MSKRSFRIAGGIVVCTLLVLGAAGYYAYSVAMAYPHEARKGTGQELSLIHI